MAWVLKPGERSDRVVVMQRALKRNRFAKAFGLESFYSGPIDGINGPATQAAVKQAKHCLGYRRVNSRGGSLLVKYLRGDRRITPAMRRRRIGRIEQARKDGLAERPRIVRPRWRWRYPLVPRIGRVRYFIEHYSASPRSTTAEMIHRWHRALYAGIGYTWVIEDDGTLVVGRGPRWRGAHTYGWNNEWAVCVPSSNEQAPSEAQIRTLRWLRRHAEELAGHPLVIRQHRDMPLNATDCAGRFWPWIR